MNKFIGTHVDLEMVKGILVAKYKTGPKIDLIAAKQILRDRINFTENKSIPVLVIDAGLVSMDKQARDFLSSEEGIQGISASAIISNSKVNSMLVNFVLLVSRPNLPVRMFTSYSEAMAWLDTYK